MRVILRTLGLAVIGGLVALRFRPVREAVYRAVPAARHTLDRYYPVGDRMLGLRGFRKGEHRDGGGERTGTGRHFETTYGEA